MIVHTVGHTRGKLVTSTLSFAVPGVVLEITLVRIRVKEGKLTGMDKLHDAANMTGIRSDPKCFQVYKQFSHSQNQGSYLLRKVHAVNVLNIVK